MDDVGNAPVARTRIPAMVTVRVLRRARTMTFARWWRNGEDVAVVDADQLEAGLVDHPVVAVAEEHEVVEVGAPAAHPVDDVVGGGPGRGSIAARPAAALVADVEGAPGGAVDDPLRAAH